MTEAEINALIDAMIDKFRELVAEEFKKYYGMGKTVSLQEVADTLKSYELNEMTRMFNSDQIPQDKFRVFLRHYLRLWFEALVTKIDGVNSVIMIVDNIDDLPDDGSVVLAIVNGELYYWNGTEWKRTSSGDDNVQSDWSQTDDDADDYIKNKPDIKYGSYTSNLISTTFNFLNVTDKQYDVLDLNQTSPSCSYTFNGIDANVPSGKTLVTRLRLTSGQSATVAFGFAYKLVDGAELSFSEGAYAITTLKMDNYSMINIAKYE
jgi:hypothetical protein